MKHVAQAGAIATRGEMPSAEVLIVTSKRTPSEWIFPKGHIEAGESAADAAVRELAEEAGMLGDVVEEVGLSSFVWGGRQFDVTYFLVRVVGTTPPEDSRAVRWCTFDEAKSLVKFADAGRLLDAAARLLTR